MVCVETFDISWLVTILVEIYDTSVQIGCHDATKNENKNKRRTVSAISNYAWYQRSKIVHVSRRETVA